MISLCKAGRDLSERSERNQDILSKMQKTSKSHGCSLQEREAKGFG